MADSPRKAPAGLALVQQFLNTFDSELGTDALSEMRGASEWLHSAGFGTDVGLMQLQMLRSLREALRTVLAEASRRTLDAEPRRILAETTANARIGAIASNTGSVRLIPAETGVPGLLSALFLAIHDSQTEGTWSRLRICQRCRWAFFDVTKNTSATWCTSRCSQRAKAARHYQRKIAQRPHSRPRSSS